MPFKFNPFSGKLDFYTIGFNPNITSPQNGDILQYDSASGEWINLLTATAQAEATVYVNASVTVTGTRNGSERYPYATIQDAIDHFGIPSTQAEYELVKTIVIQDGTNYTENLLFPTGLWYVRFNQASLTGTIDWEIDSAERQGSSTAPRLFLLKDEADISVGITGDIEVYLKSGGSAVSTSYFGVYGMIVNGNITLADGTNIGTSYSSLPIVSFKEATIASAYNFKNRLCFLSLTNSNLASSGVSLEMGTLFGARNSSINATSVLEARSSTNSKNIVGLRLNSSGGVTWDSTGSVRNWNADPITATEVIQKITSFPSNTINLTKVTAESIGIADVGGYYTGTDVEAALQEIGAEFGSLSSFYLPLSGASPMEGTLDMDGFDIDNIKQAINDGASAANPAFLTGDSGWYGTNAKTMHLSISGSDVAWLNVNGYDILDANAAFGDIQEQSSGLGVFLDQNNKQIFFGDWRGTTSDTYLETDSSVAYHRFYANGTQVLDIQANSVEFNRSLKTGGVVDVTTSTYNIVGNEPLIRVFYTTTGVCTLQLPVITAAMDGALIPIADFGVNASVNKIVVNRGGSATISGSATSYEFLNDEESHTFQADYTNNNWHVF